MTGVLYIIPNILTLFIILLITQLITIEINHLTQNITKILELSSTGLLPNSTPAYPYLSPFIVGLQTKDTKTTALG